MLLRATLCLCVAGVVFGHGDRAAHFQNQRQTQIRPALRAAVLTAPVITPSGGAFVGSTAVTISSSAAGTLRYTTDGTAPDASSSLYTANQPFTLSALGQIVVKALLIGTDTTQSSNVTTVVFHIITQPSAPTITPNGGQHVTSVAVTLTSNTPGASLRYTTDGSAPSSSATSYLGPFTLGTTAQVTSTVTIRAAA